MIIFSSVAHWMRKFAFGMSRIGRLKIGMIFMRWLQLHVILLMDRFS
jgi:hypothetical protein